MKILVKPVNMNFTANVPLQKDKRDVPFSLIKGKIYKTYFCLKNDVKHSIFNTTL